MEKEQFYNMIEQYLDGSLSGEALEAFEQRLQTEPDFVEEVALHRKLQEELGNAQKRQLRSKLDALRKDFTQKEETKVVPIDSNQKWKIMVSVAASFLVLSLAFWYFVLRGPEKPKIVDDTPPVNNEDPTPQKEDQIKEIEDPTRLVEDKTDPEKKTDPVETPPPPENLLANFEPNPELEDLIAQNGTVGDFEFSIEKPEKNKAFVLTDNKIEIQFSGMLSTSAIENENNLEVAIYNNDPQNFKSKKRIAKFQIPLEKDTSEDDEGIAFIEKDVYYFDLQKTLTLDPGLYYYLIQQKGNSTTLFTGRFEAKHLDE